MRFKKKPINCSPIVTQCGIHAETTEAIYEDQATASIMHYTKSHVQKN